MPALELAATLNRKYVAAGRESVLYLLVELMAQAEQTDGDSVRQPLNLSFVIDRSGSMSGEKLAFVKQAVAYALGQMTPRDVAALTAFDDDVEVLIAAQHVVLRDILKGKVYNMYPGGCTNLSGGLRRGFREVMNNYRAGQINRIMLLTDGLANVGIIAPDVLCRYAVDMKQAGVAISTFGVGSDFDEDLLTAMAEASGGNYYYIAASDKIPDVFAQELQALLDVAAQNVTLQMDCFNGVAVRQVWGYRPQGERTVSIALPDVYSNDRKVILMEMKVAAQAAGPVPLGRLTLCYEDAGKNLQQVSVDVDLHVEAITDPELLSMPEESAVKVQLELNKMAALKERIVFLADQGDLVGAAATAREAHTALWGCVYDAAPVVQEELSRELDSLAETEQQLRSGLYDADVRKRLKYESYRRRNGR